METNIKLEPVTDSKGNNPVFYVKKNSLHCGYFYPYPTSNCQTYCIGNMDLIMNNDDWLDILVEIQRKSTKPQLLVDIKQGTTTYSRLLEYFKDDIVINQNYVSTNSSNMCILLVKTTKLKQIINNEAKIPF